MLVQVEREFWGRIARSVQRVRPAVERSCPSLRAWRRTTGDGRLSSRHGGCVAEVRDATGERLGNARPTRGARQRVRTASSGVLSVAVAEFWTLSSSGQVAFAASCASTGQVVPVIAERAWDAVLTRAAAGAPHPRTACAAKVSGRQFEGGRAGVVYMTRRLLKTAGRLAWFRGTVRRLGLALDRLPARRQSTALDALGRAGDAGRSTVAGFVSDTSLGQRGDLRRRS
jgi:hypothetical protein